MTTATVTNTKTILIRTVGQETPREVDVVLEPTSRVSDALDAAGLLGWALQNPKGGNFLPSDNLYDAVAEGQKVMAVNVDGFSAG